MLRFDGIEYSIRSARCGGAVADPYWCDTYNNGLGKRLVWYFEMTVDDTDSGEPAPAVNFDGMYIDCSNWTQLVGKSVEWTSPINVLHNSRYGWTNTYESWLIARGSFQIAIRNGALVRVRAQGEDESANAFEIDADYTFEGIVVRGSERDAAESFSARLKQFISLDHLVQQLVERRGRYDSGVEMAECRFLPLL